jgi:hypothetical protein
VPLEPKELAQVAGDEKDQLHEFAVYLQHQLQRQQELLKEIQGMGHDLANVKQVPLIFEADTWKLIELMAGKI